MIQRGVPPATSSQSSSRHPIRPPSGPGLTRGPAFFAYSDNYLIDVKFGVIVDVEASRSIRQAEVGAARTMIERTEERFGLKPERLVGDTGYGAAPMLNWLVEEKGIAPHIPVFDKSKREDGTFLRSDFRYDPTGDVYHCPAGKILTTTGTLVNGGTTFIYLARKHDCDAANSERNAVRRSRFARFHATGTKPRAMLPGRWLAPMGLACLFFRYCISATNGRCYSPPQFTR
jgi:hypothetical protein